MMVVRRIRVEAFGAAEGLHHLDHPDGGKGQQGPVDGIKRNIWKIFFDRSEHQIRRGVLLRSDEDPVYGDTLWGDFQAVALAGFDKKLHALVVSMFCIQLLNRNEYYLSTLFFCASARCGKQAI
jgi:hypothetical protein